MCSDLFWRFLFEFKKCHYYRGSAPEHDVVVIPEREKDHDWKTEELNNSETRSRNRCCTSTKAEAPKSGPGTESCLKQNGGPPPPAASQTACLVLVSLVLLVSAGVYPARSRRKCTAERRGGGGGVCESGSDSGSSSGSVRASRGSWGSWSSTSSVEGDRDAGARTHACTTSSRKSKTSSNEVKQIHWHTTLTTDIVFVRGNYVQHHFRRARLLP